jgi:sugar phosphate isomerase/epimerase
MNKHWDSFCTMSIVHFMAFPNTIGGEGPIVETVSKIAEDPFFGAIEIGWIKDPRVRADVKAILDAAHIRVGFGGQSSLLLQKLNLNSFDEAERRAAIDQMKANIDEAVEMGARRVAFLSGKDPGDADRPRALDLLIDAVREMCAYGQDRGIGLTCETFDRGIDKACLIGPSDLAAEFARAIRADYPDFGLMYDLSHMPLLFEKAEPALTLLKDVLVHIHVGNCVVEKGLPGYGDLHPRFGWPGGCNDLPELVEFVQALFKIGYLADGKAERPWVGFEVKPQFPGETPELIIAGTKRVWQDAWAKV